MNAVIKSLLLAAAIAIAGAAAAEDLIVNFRNAPLAENPSAPPMSAQIDRDLRQVRNYPEQPPVIPHKIEGYQITSNFNKCLTCHARAATGESQAPMVSVTHFIDREGQILASVSPRRYFCNQCHVPQYPVESPVENTFIDIDRLLAAKPR